MYERFTDRARKVMKLANEEARRLEHEFIGTEHILLGLVKEGSGVAANALRNLDINLRKVRLEIEKIVQCGPEVVTAKNLPQTPRAKKVIDYALDEARGLNHNYVGTEHLLLGLLREEEGVAAQVLMNLGLKLQEVRHEIVNLIGPSMALEELPSREELDMPLAQDLNRAFMYLPEEVIQVLKEVNDRLEKLQSEKEAAIAQQDFERAAMIREEEVKIKEWLLDTVKKMQAFMRQSEEKSP
jgi:ATP-dependent Clp protease ATP-binding subunit ClpA